MKKLLLVVAAVLSLNVYAQTQPIGVLEGVPSDQDTQNFEKVLANAKQGDAQAQYTLGMMYQNGAGVAPDDSQARYWLEKSAYQDEVKAQAELGRMYLTGFGGEQDAEKGNYWLKHAADQGDLTGELYWGMIYHDSTDPQKFQKAQEYLNKACAAGKQEACELL